jgi:hypothetical protein
VINFVDVEVSEEVEVEVQMGFRVMGRSWLNKAPNLGPSLEVARMADIAINTKKMRKVTRKNRRTNARVMDGTRTRELVGYESFPRGVTGVTGVEGLCLTWGDTAEYVREWKVGCRSGWMREGQYRLPSCGVIGRDCIGRD